MTKPNLKPKAQTQTPDIPAIKVPLTGHHMIEASAGTGKPGR